MPLLICFSPIQLKLHFCTPKVQKIFSELETQKKFGDISVFDCAFLANSSNQKLRKFFGTVGRAAENRLKKSPRAGNRGPSWTLILKDVTFNPVASLHFPEKPQLHIPQFSSVPRWRFWRRKSSPSAFWKVNQEKT